jgi:hypothetical protein
VSYPVLAFAAKDDVELLISSAKILLMLSIPGLSPNLVWMTWLPVFWRPGSHLQTFISHSRIINA